MRVSDMDEYKNIAFFREDIGDYGRNYKKSK